MVSQLQIVFERNQLILSPFDEILYKQLIDYEVVKKTQNGEPIFTSVNEHFVDALGLAYLAFVLNFKELTNVIKDAKKNEFKLNHSHKKLGEAMHKNLWTSIDNTFSQNNDKIIKDDDRPGDRPTFIKVTSGSNKRKSWGSRSNSKGFSRNIW